MSKQLTRSQEDLNYTKGIRMHGKNAKRRSEAPNAILLDTDNWHGGLIFRARFHTDRSWETTTITALDDTTRNTVQGVLERVFPLRGGEYWYVHGDGASFPPMDFEDIMEWIEEKSVLAGGSERVMDVIVYDHDPMEGRDAERFDLRSRKMEKVSKKDKLKGLAKKCVIQ